MKFQVSFKTPSVIARAIEQVDYDPDTQCDCGGSCFDCDRLMAKAAQEQVAIVKIASRFIKNGEYVQIEFDTEAETATVIPIRE